MTKRLWTQRQYNSVFTHGYTVFAHLWLVDWHDGNLWPAGSVWTWTHSLIGRHWTLFSQLLFSSYHCVFSQPIMPMFLQIQSVMLVPKFLKHAHIARLGLYLLIIYYFRSLLFCKCHWASAVASDSWREQVLVITGAFKHY